MPHVTSRKLQWVRRALMAAATALLLLSAGVQATNHGVHIVEVMAGANGNSGIQFIVLQQEFVGQNLWGPSVPNGQAAAMLVFFDATGRETGTFKFPANPPTGQSLKVLVATQELANLPGAPAPNVIIPPLLNAISGKVCFRNNPRNAVFLRNECLSYGSFTGDTGINSGGDDFNVPAGPPAPALPILNTVSLKRTADTSRNADFTITATPTPINIAGATFTMPASSLTVQGENLFSRETFQGNGRTCASCHVQGESLRLPPADVQSRFAAVSWTFDPQFIGESAPSSFDAGFDFNLNTLVLTAEVPTNSPCTGQLQGIITAGPGERAKVLSRVSPTTYLVYGGGNPRLFGELGDTHGCSGTVASISAGNLNGLESPLRMRTSGHADFPQGRALILENIDGFTNPPVFRKSPHLLNLALTAPYGFSDDIPDLRTFTIGAVKQHFPRTLARDSSGTNPDFRVPTPDELAAMEAFMLAQEFPSGSDPDKFNLDRFVTTAAEQRGRDAFFGPVAKCSQCHGGPVLARTTVAILVDGETVPAGVNGTFNTGVVNQPINSVDSLPCEPTVGASCATRRFSTAQLFNVRSLGPFFHDASAATLRQAVEFYDSVAFNSSPAGIAIGGSSVAGLVDDITAFLEGLAIGSISANSPTSVPAPNGGVASPAPSVVVRDRHGAPVAGVTVTFAITAGGGSLSGAAQITDASGIATLGSWTLGTGGALTATAAGTLVGNPVTFRAFPFPTLSVISPTSRPRGSAGNVQLSGTNFVSGVTAVAVSGNGVTVSNTSVINETLISARLTIASDAELGAHNVTVTTNGGTSGAVTFSVVQAVPSLSSVSPAAGFRNTAVDVTLTGLNFIPGVTTVSVGGAGVVVGNTNVVSATSMTATFNVEPGATLGGRVVTVANGGAASGVVFFTVLSTLPTLTAVSPIDGLQGTSVDMTVSGSNFVPGSTFIAVSGTGVTVSNTNVTSATSMTATFAIASTAAPGVRDVTVTTAAGTSGSRGFIVRSQIPVLSSISPSVGVVGTSVNVALTGAFLGPVATITVAGAGVIVSNINLLSPTLITATFAVQSGATKGPRSVMVTTAGGASGAATFTVSDSFPDLTMIVANAGSFGAGFDETYEILVMNIGTAASTSTITVTDQLPSGLTFVSGSGPGFACSATGQTVTCVRSSPLAAGDSSPITLTVAVGNDAAFVNNSLMVSSVGDLNPSNNTFVSPTLVVATPSPTFTFSPNPMVAGEQATLTLSISTLFPHDFGGVISMTFTPNAAMPLDDPAIQFASGGRQVAFTFSANTTQARFTGLQPGPVGFQTGTVAGVFSFAGTLTAGTNQKQFSPVGSGALTIQGAAPKIQSVQVTKQADGFTAAVTLFATTREVTLATVTFNTTPAVTLSCGGLTECTAEGSKIVLSVKPLFDAWYSSDKTFGSLSTLRLPFTIQGNVFGTVTIMLGNSRGVSSTTTFALP